MTLGFSVETLLPHARVSGPLRMGLLRLTESEWLDPHRDLAERAAAFDAYPDIVQVLPDGEKSARELAEMLGAGSLEHAARAHWEDFCLLTQDTPGQPYRLVAAAVGFPTDWKLSEKMGRSLHTVHEPIHGYAEQLSVGVDRFMDRLRTGEIYGRTNAFVMPSNDARYMPVDSAEQRYSHVTAHNAGSALFVRCERETLRRLPQTGAVDLADGPLQAAVVRHDRRSREPHGFEDVEQVTAAVHEARVQPGPALRRFGTGHRGSRRQHRSHP